MPDISFVLTHAAQRHDAIRQERLCVPAMEEDVSKTASLISKILDDGARDFVASALLLSPLFDGDRHG